jgi:hypothetical protein
VLEADEVLTNVIFFGILALLFLGMVAMQIAGHHYALRRTENDPVAGSEGSAAVEASLYALLGLLVAFTFSGAQDRLNARRQLIVEEVQSIGTAYDRLDLLRPEDAAVLREEMRQYVDARLAYYDKLLDFAASRVERRRAEAIQHQIWAHAVPATARLPDVRGAQLVLPALNQVFDVATARYAALRTHVPGAIFILLLALSLVCAFFAGIGMAKRRGHPSYLHMLMFAGIMSITAYVILNLEFPRAGFVSLHHLDSFLREERAAMQ